MSDVPPSDPRRRIELTEQMLDDPQVIHAALVERELELLIEDDQG